MTALVWDQTGERTYETGVDHGALFVTEDDGTYGDGVAWNGLTTVTESPSGAEATPTYADNIKYLNLISREDFGGTIEAYTYPDEFGVCDGTAEPVPGLRLGQQSRRTFGLAYRTLFGNDTEGTDYGFKIHLIYGALAAPSEKAYATVNDTPEAIAFSWAITTTPVPVTDFKPLANIVLDSTVLDADSMATFLGVLFGTSGEAPRLPLPDEVIGMFSGSITLVTATEPTYVSGTHTMTIPTIVGVQYYVDGAPITPGAHVITENTVVTARPEPGYEFNPISDDSFTIFF